MKKIKMINLKKIMFFILMFIFIFPLFFIPTKSYAHNAFFLQVLIDDSSMTYMGNVVKDDASFCNAESKHLENQITDFSKLIGNYGNNVDLSEILKLEEGKEGSGSQFMPFTFPSKEIVHSDGILGLSNRVKNDRTGDDADRAYYIKDMLLPGLNDVLRMMNNGKKYDSINDLVKNTQTLLGASSVTLNGEKYSVHWGQRIPNSTDIPHGSGASVGDYVYFESEGHKRDYEFLWKIPKGYRVVDNKNDKDAFKLSKNGFAYTGDAEFITWGMMVYQATYSYYGYNYTMKYAGEQAKPGPLTEAVTELFSWVYNGIKNVLGLYNLDELIFNEGIRGSSAYRFGILPSNWANNVNFYHIIFQVLAWALILFAVAKMFVQRNLSTINPSMRVSLINEIQSLLITGFILAFAFPIISILMKANFNLVKIFYSASTRSFAETFNEVSAYSNVIGAIIVQFVYLFINIYMNYVYIIRSIIIALLVASAPIFIVSLSFGGNMKQCFMTWVKELFSNIFLQSFHAFALSFFTGIAISTRGIETLVVMGALIPLTNFFRQMICGSNGQTSHMLGNEGLSNTLSNIGSVTKSIKNNLAGNKNNEDGDDKSKEKQDSNIKTKSSDKLKMPNMGESFVPKSKKTKLSLNDMGSLSERVNAHNEVISSKSLSPKDINFGNSSSSESSALGSGASKDTLDKAKNREKVDKLVSCGAGVLKAGKELVPGVGKTAIGATVAGVGLGITAFTGQKGIGDQMINTGINVGKKGISQSAKVVSPTLDRIKNSTVDGIKNAGSAISNNLGITSNDDNLVTSTNGSERYYQSELFSESTGEGNSLVYRDLNSLRDEGIENISSNGENATFTYTPNITGYNKDTDSFEFDNTSVQSFNTKDLNNLQSYVKAFENPQSKEANNLQSIGIQHAGLIKNDRGGYNFQVVYDKKGKNTLGFADISKFGEDKIVEKKEPIHPHTTRKTIDIPSRQPNEYSTNKPKTFVNNDKTNNN